MMRAADFTPGRSPEPDAEAQEWEAADLSPTLAPYDWGAAGEPDGETVRYVPGVGFVGADP
ncbi:hypothetical protein F8S09_14205 [Deinococcus sp. SDU3-2]|uniref:Uncharacterized protein n=1 Tax=Deinococcus terrestris TaxID=2651870 RepID=A0A7X1NYQ7_9DEIO|nr:hypothetical protein [Deinococcus terrestris]MPY67821.1 hypothetical protein [Deinococcus terrestris]